jgi:hypothetical protein
MVVAAGNAVEDGAVAYEMGTALSDRLIHMLVRADPLDWLENYAARRGLHPAVIAFIRTRADLLETTETALAEGRAIAATPRSWERVSDILGAVADRRTRDVMVAGAVGEAVAAEFALVADDVAATVRIDAMLEASPGERITLFPPTLHGLNALVYGLVGVLDARTAPAAIAILADLRRLAETRPEPEFRRLPLGELATYGFELLIGRGLALGLGEVFVASPAYRDYAAERRALGLERARALTPRVRHGRCGGWARSIPRWRRLRFGAPTATGRRRRPRHGPTARRSGTGRASRRCRRTSKSDSLRTTCCTSRSVTPRGARRWRAASAPASMRRCSTSRPTRWSTRR